MAFVSCAEAGWPDVALGQQVEAASPDWLQRYLAAKRSVEAALATRNTERQLEGKPPYESLEAMVEAYQQYEGDDLGLSREACEDEVLNYLSRKALADEGALDGSPQDYIGFGLLALLVAFVSINGAG